MGGMTSTMNADNDDNENNSQAFNDGGGGVPARSGTSPGKSTRKTIVKTPARSRTSSRDA
jgi:hypothetical protein